MMANFNKSLITINQTGVRKACLECVLNAEKPRSAAMVAKAIGVPYEIAESTLYNLYAHKEIHRRQEYAGAGGSWWVYLPPIQKQGRGKSC